MTKPLRKRHLQVWIALAILLPIGILCSWLAIPNPVSVKTINRQLTPLLPLVKVNKETEAWCANIRTDNENNAWQLEWKNKIPLTAPSSLIYKSTIGDNDLKNAQLIGRIEARGDYIFALPPDPAPATSVYILYDFIHQKIIDKFIFKTDRLAE